MILGHAAYSANELANPQARARDDDAEGVLRGAARISPHRAAARLPQRRAAGDLQVARWSPPCAARRATTASPSWRPPVGSKQTIHVFLGLITNAEDGTVGRVPVVRRRIAEILLRSGVRADSHSGRRLLAALRTLPRDELLEAPTGDLLRLAQLVVERAEDKTVGVFARIHLNRDFVSVLVYFPADRFGPETRRRVQEVIIRNWPGEIIGRDDRIVELDLARMQFLIAVRPGTQPPSPERAGVEAEVAKVTRRWRDDLFDLLTERRTAWRPPSGCAGGSPARIPEAYKEDFACRRRGPRPAHPRRAAAPRTAWPSRCTRPTDEHEDADRRLKVFRTGEAVSLARALPIFTRMGIEVLDERPYEFELPDAEDVWIYDFGLRLPADIDFDDDASAATSSTRVRLLWRERIEQDGFNELVVRTGHDLVAGEHPARLREVPAPGGNDVQPGLHRAGAVRLSARSRRASSSCSRRASTRSAAPTTRQHGGCAGRAARGAAERGRQPRPGPASCARCSAWCTRRCARTPTAPTATRAVSAKAPATTPAAPRWRSSSTRGAIPDLPAPRPHYEIWVYSPRVEGVHLRFGAVARGGLRWSDRREDFRTEILGLVKAQMVKNAVIVPTGSKGGFVPKQLPDPTSDREAWLAEGIACYRTFISCLLDVTDNYVLDGPGAGVQTIVPPPRTRRYDGDDPYLVVAADKGTATFSDIANEHRGRLRVLAGRRLRQRRLGRLRPQGDGHHRPRRVGVGEVSLPRDGYRHPDAGLHRRRHRRHVR